MGIGGSVLFSTIRGKAEGQEKRSNAYFTASVIGSIFLAAVIWLVVIFFDRELLLLFGAQDNTHFSGAGIREPHQILNPLFLFNQMLAAYLRNDKNPGAGHRGCVGGRAFQCVLGIISLSLHAIWARMARGLPRPSVRPSRLS